MSDKVVLVTDYTWPSTDPEAQVLEKVGARLLVAKSGSEEELLHLVAQADAILTCFAKVPASVVRAGEKLQVIGRYGIGVDNIAVDEATRLGIPVTNVPAYCLDEVAEHAMAMLLALARKICRYDTAVRQGNWELQTGMPMFRVHGRTLGILGFGKIGQTMAAKAQAFGLRIIAYDPYISPDVIRQKQAEPVTLEELFARSDFLSVHSPATPETQGLVNLERLRLMKPTAFLINAARGAIVDQEALLTALEQNWIAGAALDVFVPERLPASHPLLALPNLIATPHVAFYSEESVLELEIKAAENVAAVLSGQRPAAIVNPEVLKLPRWAHLQ
ncbi:MAG: C-terminal binding protein [Chloroflexi bacterium]|nr:C-terminal binding protein [Chloroflexota bacterium]